MATEIEAKFRLADTGRIRRFLLACGAVCRGAVLETNRYFDRPDGRLQSADCGLRIRTVEPIAGPDLVAPTAGAWAATVTYKGPRQGGPLKIRREEQFSTDDAAAAEAVLVALGMVNTLTFQKRRESWILDDCRVDLDELPGLGHFVEVEGPTEQAVADVVNKLDLHGLPMEPTPYSTMLSVDQRDRRPAGEPITF